MPKIKFWHLHTVWYFLELNSSVSSRQTFNCIAAVQVDVTLISWLTFCCLHVRFWMVPLRVWNQPEPRPDWYLLGVPLKFSEGHPRPKKLGHPPRHRSHITKYLTSGKSHYITLYYHITNSVFLYLITVRSHTKPHKTILMEVHCALFLRNISYLHNHI